ncbi:CLUMA_CG013082, isoform A [Clunio marinus]|uniref:CLUMA_CG013082, isoform A n=1 Tax=Clunio marinus TaxID=568069 RepID=A0A1J1IKQ4_9DIPT|nr:CLUMA_CG013082, isoform A [Clunio marinus]
MKICLKNYCGAIFKTQNIKNNNTEYNNIGDVTLREILFKFFNSDDGAPGKTYKMGICVPKSCSSKDLYELSKQYDVNKIATIKSFECIDPPTMNLFDGFALSVLLLIIFLNVGSTLCQILFEKLGKPSKLLSIFSIKTNFERLMRRNESNSAIGCIDALKALSAFWIMFGHRSQRFAFSYEENSQWWSYLLGKLMNRYEKGVITFFVCSAILLTISLLRDLDTSNLPQFLVSGPEIGELIHRRNLCREGWLPYLTLTQNYAKTWEYCLSYTWYLSTDFQLFYSTPLIVYCIWKLKAKSFVVFPMLIVLLQVFKYYRMFISVDDNISLYVSTEYRLGQYMIGILTGYIIYDRKDLKFRTSNVKIAIAWVLTTFFFCDTFFDFKLPNILPLDRIYKAINDDLWSCSICWIVFACHCLKSGGIFRSFLSHYSWQPLSRMCLCIYLVHYQYVVLTNINQKQNISYGKWWKLHIQLGDVMMCTIISAVFHLFVEAPGIQLVSLLWRRQKRSYQNIKNLPESHE